MPEFVPLTEAALLVGRMGMAVTDRKFYESVTKTAPDGYPVTAFVDRNELIGAYEAIREAALEAKKILGGAMGPGTGTANRKLKDALAAFDRLEEK